MSLLDSLKNLIGPKPRTPEQELIARYHLTRDTGQPFTYWLNGRHFIQFDPSDPVSLENAEKEIRAFYQSPRIQKGSRHRQSSPERREYPRRDEWQDIRDLGDDFQSMTDFFTEDFDPKKALPPSL